MSDKLITRRGAKVIYDFSTLRAARSIIIGIIIENAGAETMDELLRIDDFFSARR